MRLVCPIDATSRGHEPQTEIQAMAKRRTRSVAGKSPAAYARLKEYKAAVLPTASYEALGAHSIGIGRKLVNGKPTGELSLRVYVAKKLPMSAVPSGQRIPEQVRFFSRGTNKEEVVTTDVIETPPPIFEQLDPTDRHRPAPGGVSVDGISGTAGTLGGWVWDTTDDTIVSLSNHHVYGHTAGTDVVQPGPFDGGSSPADKIGDTKRGIQRRADITNTVDCAIADADSTDVYDLSVPEIGPAVYAIAVPALDLLVEKFGRTTRHTFGEITDADLETTVDGLPFDDCCRVDVVAPSADWSAGGDSGSLVFSQTPVGDGSAIKPAVALHFAGPAAGTYGVVCKIQNVFAQLQLTTLCAGAFEAFMDSLFETETIGEVSEATEARLRRLAALAATGPVFGRGAPRPFERKAQLTASARRLPRGLARDVQTRLATSRSGRLITQFVDAHRAELVTLLAKDGDVRRATVAAFKPLLAGATTTTEVLQRVFTKEDLARLDRLAREVSGKAGSRLKRALAPINALKGTAERKSIAKVLGITL